jgi:hypothetical protein
MPKMEAIRITSESPEKNQATNPKTANTKLIPIAMRRALPRQRPRNHRIVFKKCTMLVAHQWTGPNPLAIEGT